MSNFYLADLVNNLKIAKRGHLKSINVKNTKLAFCVLEILYLNGFIKGFVYKIDKIRVYLKYNQNNLTSFCIDFVSTPGHRVYWSLEELAQNYNRNNLSGFYIISTSRGLRSSTDCLFGQGLGGEVLLKISI